MANKEYSVTEIANIIYDTVDTKIEKFISVFGEIYSVSSSNPNFIYFDIGDKDLDKNNSPIIKCAINKRYTNIDFANVLKEGNIIICKGSFSFYKTKSQVTLWANKVEIYLDEIGKALLKRKEILDKFNKEGLLNKEQKKLKRIVNNVGILTANNSAAYNDIIQTLNKKFPVNTFLFPCSVQGDEAPKSIMKSLSAAYKKNLDVILISRGGGSKTDLSCFDDEDLARLISQSKIPIITSIGHSIDKSICDYVSDYNAITPTEGASLINPSLDDIKVEIENYKLEIENRYDIYINNKLDKINYYKNILSSYSPIKRINNYKDILKNYKTNLNNLYFVILNKYNQDIYFYVNSLKNKYLNKINNYINLLSTRKNLLNKNISDLIYKYRDKIFKLKTKVEEYNPTYVSSKGYAQILSNNKQIKSINELKSNDEIDIVFSDGRKKAIIK